MHGPSALLVFDLKCRHEASSASSAIPMAILYRLISVQRVSKKSVRTCRTSNDLPMIISDNVDFQGFGRILDQVLSAFM